MLRNSSKVLILVGFFSGILFLCGYFWWMASFDPKINFLTSKAPAEWIIYPEGLTRVLRRSVEVDATFRHSFVVQKVPQAAKLSIRAMKRWELSLNGSRITSGTALNSNWKDVTDVDVHDQLHAGTNEILVTVFNSNGPPALWLTLLADGRQLNSDSDWKVRLSDSVECDAMPAASPPGTTLGNWFRITETPSVGFRHHPLFFLGATLSSILLFWAMWRLKGVRRQFITSPEFAFCAVAFLALLWGVLYCNNLRVLGLKDGFDSQDHLDYVQRIQSRPGLPLANEGWQMYQPPLYYLLSAALLDIVNPETIHGILTTVRVLGLCIGVAHLALIFLSLRLIFPGQSGAPFFGLLLAAFLPAHLYISQFVTNEALAAMLVTACCFLCLKIIVENRDSWRIFLGVGICLGAAILAKVTALIAAPFVGAALFDPSAFRDISRLKTRAAKTAASAAACLIVCGWHYYRVWSHFGSPLVGNWDAAAAAPWWMEPGFQTWSWFLRFGQCLTHPWFSGYNGFADGIYSTLWGDGLFGGRIAVGQRAPWNYELMAAGFVLSLIPSIFIAVGAISAVKTFLQRPTRIWLLLVGLPLATLGALIYMNLKMPTYAEAKAFYGLIALLPLCAFGAAGYETLKRLGTPCVAIALVLFGIWGINSYASFWILTDTSATEMHLALEAVQEARYAEGLQHYSAAVRFAPRDIELKALMAGELAVRGRNDDVRQIAAQAMEDPLPDSDSHGCLAKILSLNGQRDAAMVEVRKSIAAATNGVAAYGGLCECLYQAGNYAEAIAAGREWERSDFFNPALHFYLGRAFSGLGDETNAAMHFRLATQLKADSADLCDQFGLCLMALHRWDEATNQFYGALQLRPQDPVIHYHLAVAFAGAGDTSREVEQYRGILQSDRKFLPALESLAWRLATSPDVELRDGGEAAQLASRACKLTETNDVRCLETLAAAYACTKQYGDATRTAQQAIEVAQRLGETNDAVLSQRLLKLYQSSKSYIDEAPGNAVVSPDSVLTPAEK